MRVNGQYPAIDRCDGFGVTEATTIDPEAGTFNRTVAVPDDELYTPSPL
jgi:hypothetical protein